MNACHAVVACLQVGPTEFYLNKQFEIPFKFDLIQTGHSQAVKN
jgi:predicted nucleic-acid-binding Zn-ribbon protein